MVVAGVDRFFEGDTHEEALANARAALIAEIRLEEAHVPHPSDQNGGNYHFPVQPAIPLAEM